MSIYGSIGYTRRDRERERILKPIEKIELKKLETELRIAQDERDAVYDNYDITDEELKELVKPLQEKVDDLIDRVCKIKYEKVR
jgi:hypothetical protein